MNKDYLAIDASNGQGTLYHFNTGGTTAAVSSDTDRGQAVKSKPRPGVVSGFFGGSDNLG